MARINYDDGVETMPFFKKLARILKDEDKARGMLIRLWRLGQKYWADGQQLIPVYWFEFEDLRPTMEAGFCEMTERGVYVKGSEEHFAWLLERKEAARRGGKARARAPRDEQGKFYRRGEYQPGPSQQPSQHPASAGSVAGFSPADSSQQTTPLAPALAPALALAPAQIPPAPPAGAADRVTPEWLAKTWNERCGPLRKINDPFMLNSERRLKAMDRIREYPRQAQWIEAIDRMAKSEWCQGKKSTKPELKGWKADFDFLLGPGRVDQALEGKFDNAETPRIVATPPQPRPEHTHNPDSKKQASEAMRALGWDRKLKPAPKPTPLRPPPDPSPEEVRDLINQQFGEEPAHGAELEEA